ncbi:MAG: hypothetical protein ACUVT2_05910 [Thiobacillaceae bacterium]
MKRIVVVWSSLILLILTGCATEVPVPMTFPYTTQQKLKSAHHWDVIAKDVAQQIASAMAKYNLSASPVIVMVEQPKAPF